jgi:hypothetical protein
MYQRALDGYAKAISPKDLITYVPALNNIWAFASLRESQGRLDDARYCYSQALVGYEKTFGPDHDKCKPLRNKLTSLVHRTKGRSSLADGASIEDRLLGRSANSIASPTKPASYRHRLFAKLSRKQSQG